MGTAAPARSFHVRVRKIRGESLAVHGGDEAPSECRRSRTHAVGASFAHRLWTIHGTPSERSRERIAQSTSHAPLINSRERWDEPVINRKRHAQDPLRSARAASGPAARESRGRPEGALGCERQRRERPREVASAPRWLLGNQKISRGGGGLPRCGAGPASLATGTSEVAARQPATAGSPDRLPVFRGNPPTRLGRREAAVP